MISNDILGNMMVWHGIVLRINFTILAICLRDELPKHFMADIQADIKVRQTQGQNSEALDYGLSI